MTFERLDTYYEDALRAYMEIEKKSSCTPTAADKLAASRMGCNHIGVFLTWVIRRNLEGDIHRQYVARELEQVRHGELTGVDFFLQCCDGKFWDEDVQPELVPFVQEYYCGEAFWKDYVDWVLANGGIPMEYVSDWNEYLQFEPVLDAAWAAYRREQK